MPEFYAGGIVYTIRVDDQTGVGVEKATEKIRGFGTETAKSDVKLKSLSRDTSILGGSLASLGGMAMVAGTAIGGPLGSSLQSAGMGVAFVGTGLTTVVPALKGLSVMIEGTLIPALIKLNAFLGPAGWIVLGLGAAATAAVLFASKARTSADKWIEATEDEKKAVDELFKSYYNLLDIKDKIAGIPKEKRELEAELKGAQISERRAQKTLRGVLKDPEATALDLEEAQYGVYTANEKINEINEALAALPGKESRLQAQARTQQRAFTTAFQRQALAPPRPYAVEAGAPVLDPLGMYEFAPGPSKVTWSKPDMTKSFAATASAPFRDIVIQINGTVTDQLLRIPEAKMAEAKMASDMYTDSRLTRLASAQGYPNAG